MECTYHKDTAQPFSQPEHTRIIDTQIKKEYDQHSQAPLCPLLVTNLPLTKDNY